MHLKSASLWLLACGVLHVATSPTPPSATSSSDCFGAPINDRNKYLSCAKKYGLCRKKGSETAFPNVENRKLVLPGEDVLTKFDAIHLMADVGYNPESTKHVDSKEFVDLSRTISGQELDQKLSSLCAKGGLTVAQFKKWNNTAISSVQELKIYTNKRFPHTPAFISRIRPQARILRAWTKIVHHKWNTLDRTLMQAYRGYLLPGPGSPASPHGTKVEPEQEPEKYITSAIRLEHPFVVAGGRFREQYYWDSFFIIEGLLAAKMTYLARTTLLNFMDQIKAYGFIPNGARKYYLNRSQPPLFIHMLHAYVNNTGDDSILHEALPLAERELRWWDNERSVKVAYHPNGGEKTVYTVYQYRVSATGPRPESYAEDWRSAWCFEDGEEAPPEKKVTDLYSEFASGAESGWDYTARWMNQPFDLPHDDDKNLKNLKQMKRLEIRRMIPVDLNSIIYRSHILMAELYKLAENNESPFAKQYARNHRHRAQELHNAIIALHWDPVRAAFFDFILDQDYTEGQEHTGKPKFFWSAASLAPYWSGIRPNEFNTCKFEKSKEGVMKAFSGIRKLLDTYPGPIPTTLVESGQQWDFPNAWPPLQYIAIKALESIPEKCIEKTTVKHFVDTQPPEGQLGVQKLPDQPGPAPKVNYNVSPSWRDSLVKAVAMRYMTSTFCTWRVPANPEPNEDFLTHRYNRNKKGNFPEDRAEIVERDNPARDPALTYHPGDMYEKLSAASPVEGGKGGEYEVQTGFGWTNGIAIWIAHEYGAILDDPKCPPPVKDEPQTAENLLGGDLMFQA